MSQFPAMGEVSLAYRRVLLLDEITEPSGGGTLDMLRQPLESEKNGSVETKVSADLFFFLETESNWMINIREARGQEETSD